LEAVAGIMSAQLGRSLSQKSLPGSEKSAKSDRQKRDESSVHVVVRLRPPESSDEDIKETYALDNTTVIVRDPLSRGRMEHSFTFNQVFKPEDGQEVVFDAVAKPLVDHLLSGFNSCIFAYGQTGSGKTHSVFGEGNAEQRGLLARSIEYLFDRIESQSEQKEVGMVVSLSGDLLGPGAGPGTVLLTERRGQPGKSEQTEFSKCLGQAADEELSISSITNWQPTFFGTFQSLRWHIWEQSTFISQGRRQIRLQITG